MGVMMTSSDMATDMPMSGVTSGTTRSTAASVNLTSAYFRGESGRLAWLVFFTTILTIITLGIYRFWMKTRVRQYYWNAIRVDDEPLEYTGTALELFVGFLIAILFLAVYLGSITLGLLYFSIVQFEQIPIVAPLTAIAVLPFLPYAAYRSQRYLLSRTRWRGIRFGLDLAAWSYTLRWFLWALLSILTLGLTSPLGDYSLRRFITARMSFGDQKFRLEGGAGGLYAGYMWLWAIGAATLVTLIYVSVSAEQGINGEPVMDPGAITLVVGLYIAAILAYFWYSGYRLRYIINNTTFGDNVRLHSDLSPWRLVGIMIGGYLLMMLVVVATIAVLGVIAYFVTDALETAGIGLSALSPDSGEQLDPAAIPIFAAIFLAAFLAINVVVAVCAQLFIIHRITARIVEGTRVENLQSLGVAKQQPHAETGGEGFADALDVGAF